MTFMLNEAKFYHKKRKKNKSSKGRNELLLLCLKWSDYRSPITSISRCHIHYPREFEWKGLVINYIKGLYIVIKLFELRVLLIFFLKIRNKKLNKNMMKLKMFEYDYLVYFCFKI